jgi:MOSC domain-containing protein YiiM
MGQPHRPPGRLASINTSTSGVPKRGRPHALVTVRGVEGDRQRLAFHGGSARAAVVYSLEAIEALRQEGHPIDIGTTGENLTVSGIDWPSVVPGAELKIGEVRLLVTSYTSPCDQIRGSFRDGDITRMSQKRHPGWSRVCARVIDEGMVTVGDAVAVVRPAGDRP